MVIVHDGRPCTCGRKGCWETYSSATGLIKTTTEKLEACRAEGRQTIMEDLVKEMGRVSGRTAFDAMRAGETPKTTALNEYLYTQYFEPVLARGEDIYYITFSHQMSGTFGAMKNVIAQLKEKYPEATQEFRFEKVEPPFVENSGSGVGNHGEEEDSETNKLVKFLDTKSIKRKIELLDIMRNELNDNVVNAICISLDIPEVDGTLEEKYDSIRRVLETKERYERGR